MFIHLRLIQSTPKFKVAVEFMIISCTKFGIKLLKSMEDEGVDTTSRYLCAIKNLAAQDGAEWQIFLLF